MFLYEHVACPKYNEVPQDATCRSSGTSQSSALNTGEELFAPLLPTTSLSDKSRD
jgi:hypothetical protein